MNEVKVKEAMVPLEEYTTVSHEATLFDAIMSIGQRPSKGKSEHRSVLVLDGTNKVIGKLTYVELLQGLEPKYSKIGDLDSMRRFGLSGEFVTFMRKHFGLWEGSFRDLCEKSLRTKVKDVLRSPGPEVMVDEESSITDAIHQLMVGSDVSLLVTRGKEIIGILRLIDAFDMLCEEIKKCAR